MFNTIFDGRVVAKLPFTPIYWIQVDSSRLGEIPFNHGTFHGFFLFPCFNFFACKGLSHRNLLGDDMTDCSFIFLYILCTMSIR